LRDEFSLEARIYDKVWGQADYDSDVKFLDELFKKHRCKRIIDVACGTGNHALKLSKIGYDVTGLDIGSGMIERAKAKDKEAKVKFVLGDMRKLDKFALKDQRFDAAICLGVATCHLTTNLHVRAFLKGLHGLLRKKGLLVFDARNAEKISEDYLNKLTVEHTITEDDLQLLLLAYSTRDLRDRNTIVWRPIYLMNENGKVDFQIREHKLRWFQPSTLKKLLTENGFEIIGQYAGPNKDVLEECKRATMWFLTAVK
jgi:ubiquinone/menaquinone biosynthesis C-methylase UbiE